MKRAFAALLSLALGLSAFPGNAAAQLAARVVVKPPSAPIIHVPVGALSPLGASALPLWAPSSIRISPTLSLPNPSLPLPLSGEGGVRAAAAPPHPSTSLRAPAAAAASIAPLYKGSEEGPSPIVTFEIANDDHATGPRRVVTSRARGRIAVRFAELSAAFDAKMLEGLPVANDRSAAPVLANTQGRAGVEAAASPVEERSPSSPKAPKPARSRTRGLFGIAPALVFFLAALAVESVGIEAQNLGLPPLIAKVFGDVTLSAEMGMWASLADIVGSVVTPVVIKGMGLKQTFIWSSAARLVISALTAGLLATSHLSVPGLMGLTAVAALAGGVNYTAEKAIPAVLLDQDRAGLERFKAARQGVIEVTATIIPIVAGAAVSTFGFMPAVWAFPAAALLATVMVALTLRMPQRAMKALRSPPPQHVPAGIKDFLQGLTVGTKLLWTDSKLRLPFLGYAAFGILSHLLYWIVAPAFGILIAGQGHEEGAALVQGWMLGLFSLGGFAASVYLMREHRRFDKLAPTARDEAMRRSLRRWMILGAASLAAVVTMAFPLPAFGALTIPALALIPFGMAQVVAKLKLEALFQANAPADQLDDATAALEAWMSVFIMAGLFGMKLAFANFAGYGAFGVLAWAALPLGLACLWLTRLLAGPKKSV